MKQINFRVDEELYEILKLLASQLDESIPNLSKKIILDNLSDIRKKIALKGYEEKKIGLKKAWKISGLSFLEFNNLLIESNIEPQISDNLDDKLIDIALNIKKSDILKEK